MMPKATLDIVAEIKAERSRAKAAGENYALGPARRVVAKRHSICPRCFGRNQYCSVCHRTGKWIDGLHNECPDWEQ